MSALFPELDKELVNRILRGVIVLVEGEPAAGHVLDTMAVLGLVQKKTQNYVQCANREDPDYPDCPDENCPGLIYFEEFASTYSCPECGRPVYGIEDKQMFTEYEVTLDISGIKKHVRRVFLRLDLVKTISDDKGGAFQVTLSDDRPLSLCLLDEAESTKQDTLYIQVSPLAKPDGGVLHIIELADFLSQPMAEIKNLWSQHLDILLLTTDQLELLEILANKFDLEGIRELCFKLPGVDYDDLAGEGKRAKARELISALSRRNRLPELVTIIKQERPDLI